MNEVSTRSSKKVCRPRRGFMLAELMAVTAVGSVVFGVAVVSLAMMWRIGGRVCTDNQLAAVRARLAEQFRVDVRAAADWSTQQDGDELVIRFAQGDDVVVKYTIRRHIVQRRRESREDGSASDHFVFGEGTTCRITAGGDEASEGLLRLELDYLAGDGKSGARRHDLAQARLGADRRFVANQERKP